MADVVRATFFPAITLGLICCLRWLHRPDRNEHLGLFLVGIALIASPQFAVVIAGNSATVLSLYGVLYRQAVLAFWLSGAGAFAAWRVVRALQGRPLSGHAPMRGRQITTSCLMGIIAIACGGFGLYTATICTADVLLPHRVFTGPITHMSIERRARSAPAFHVVVGGRRVVVARALYARLRPGKVAHAEMTAGSHTILSVSLPTPPH